MKSFHAQNAWVTTSQMGQPGYRVQASDIFVEPRSTGEQTQQIDPQTGMPVTRDQYWITALNSQLLVGEVPLFYVPQATVPIEETGTVAIPEARLSTLNTFSLIASDFTKSS